MSLEYVQYETAPEIANKWRDSDLIGECWRCHMDDCPIVTGRDLTKFKMCKWCVEFENITYHLKYNGLRSQRKENVSEAKMVLIMYGLAAIFFFALYMAFRSTGA